MSPTDCEFALNGLTLRGRRWGEAGGSPVLALHGWLDNCASFDFVVPPIVASGRYDIVALDLAGHGLSDHRAVLSAYNIWQDIIEILQVTEQLGWTEFAVIGHSRGAMIATLFAATYPEKVTHLVGVESLLPGTAAETEAPTQLRTALDSLRVLSQKSFNYHASFDAAVKARESGFMPLIHPDALALARRGVRQSDKGFYWGNDPKLLAPSEIKLTAGQVDAFVQNLQGDGAGHEKPVAVFIVGSRGIKELYSDAVDSIQKYPAIQVQHLDGDHHLHMSVGAEAVARVVTEYFQL